MRRGKLRTWVLQPKILGSSSRGRRDGESSYNPLQLSGPWQYKGHLFHEVEPHNNLSWEQVRESSWEASVAWPCDSARGKKLTPGANPRGSRRTGGLLTLPCAHRASSRLGRADPMHSLHGLHYTPTSYEGDGGSSGILGQSVRKSQSSQPQF